MRQRIGEGDTSARKVWLSPIIARIKVDAGAIRPFFRKVVLEQYGTANASANLGVRTFEAEWRAGQDETANSYVIEVPV